MPLVAATEGTWSVKKVGLGEELVTGQVLEVHRFVEAFLHEHVVDFDVEFEAIGTVSNELSDVSHADDSEVASLDSTAFGKLALVPRACLQHGISVSDSPVNTEQQAHGQLSNRVRVHSGAVGHVDGTGGTVLPVDGVVAGAGSEDQGQVGGGSIDGLGGHFGRSHHQNLWLVLIQGRDKAISTEVSVILDIHS